MIHLQIISIRTFLETLAFSPSPLARIALVFFLFLFVSLLVFFSPPTVGYENSLRCTYIFCSTCVRVLIELCRGDRSNGHQTSYESRQINRVSSLVSPRKSRHFKVINRDLVYSRIFFKTLNKHVGCLLFQCLTLRDIVSLSRFPFWRCPL